MVGIFWLNHALSVSKTTAHSPGLKIPIFWCLKLSVATQGEDMCPELQDTTFPQHLLSNCESTP